MHIPAHYPESLQRNRIFNIQLLAVYFGLVQRIITFLCALHLFQGQQDTTARLQSNHNACMHDKEGHSGCA